MVMGCAGGEGLRGNDGGGPSPACRLPSAPQWESRCCPHPPPSPGILQMWQPGGSRTSQDPFDARPRGGGQGGASDFLGGLESRRRLGSVLLCPPRVLNGR